MVSLLTTQPPEITISYFILLIAILAGTVLI